MSVEGLFTELAAHELTVRSSMIEAEFTQYELFLGHSVGKGKMKPMAGKVSKSLRLEVPTTKKQVRAVVGLTNFYKSYVPNFATMVSPLVDLTKKYSTFKGQMDARVSGCLQHSQKGAVV